MPGLALPWRNTEWHQEHDLAHVEGGRWCGLYCDSAAARARAGVGQTRTQARGPGAEPGRLGLGSAGGPCHRPLRAFHAAGDHDSDSMMIRVTRR